jgi:hypothetical protein
MMLARAALLTAVALTTAALACTAGPHDLSKIPYSSFAAEQVYRGTVLPYTWGFHVCNASSVVPKGNGQCKDKAWFVGQWNGDRRGGSCEADFATQTNGPAWSFYDGVASATFQNGPEYSFPNKMLNLNIACGPTLALQPGAPNVTVTSFTKYFTTYYTFTVNVTSSAVC